MKTAYAKTAFLLILVLSVTSCFFPDKKETYLKNFEKFVKDVEKNRAKFTAIDWRWANKRFSKYCGEWYEKFKNDLKMDEKIRVSVLKTRYLLAKDNSSIGRSVNDNLEKNIREMGEDIKEYMKKDLNKDIREISKGAREIGDSAVKVMEDVMKGLKKDNNNGNH